jgi:nitroimidazol reductase NimA-like FMN-containing flavoprotein (pyridoxamine 5'-phosphate oxidase superfamily)
MPYHIRRTDREIKDPEALEQVIKSGKYATIALCKNNQPYLVTLSYGYDGKNKSLYFHGAGEGQKIDFIKANSKACLTIIDHKGFIENECEHSYRSVVMKGEMKIIEDEEGRVQAVRVLIDHFEKDAARMMKMVNTNTMDWKRTAMFQFKIHEMTGKEKNITAEGSYEQPE